MRVTEDEHPGVVRPRRVHIKCFEAERVFKALVMRRVVVVDLEYCMRQRTDAHPHSGHGRNNEVAHANRPRPDEARTTTHCLIERRSPTATGLLTSRAGVVGCIVAAKLRALVQSKVLIVKA
eukprot:3203216-Prymnesium_polylepis.2